MLSKENVTVPSPIAIMLPSFEMVATSVSLLVHSPSEFGVKFVVSPTHKVVGPVKTGFGSPMIVTASVGSELQ